MMTGRELLDKLKELPEEVLALPAMVYDGESEYLEIETCEVREPADDDMRIVRPIIYIGW